MEEEEEEEEDNVSVLSRSRMHGARFHSCLVSRLGALLGTGTLLLPELKPFSDMCSEANRKLGTSVVVVAFHRRVHAN
jgi:hypothetical protein